MKKFKALLSHKTNLGYLEKYFAKRADAFEFAKNYGYEVETVTEVNMGQVRR